MGNRLFNTVDSPVLKQSWTMSAILISMLVQGMLLSYPTTLLPSIMSGDSSISVDISVASYIVSIARIAGIPGFLLLSVLMDVCGRRIAYAVLLLPAVVGALCIFFATNVTSLMIGMFLCGLTASAAGPLGTIIVGEYSCPEYRGMFLALIHACGCFGMMLAHMLMPFISWRTQALISISPLVLCFGIILTWPESPYWLITKQRFEKSESSFYYLRGKSIESRKELKATIQAQQYRMSMQPQNIGCFDKFGNFIEKFTQKDFLKPLLVAMLAAIVLTASGMHIFSFYAWNIVKSLAENLDPIYRTLLVDIILTASAFFASLIIIIVNRRTLLFSTGFATFVIILLTSVYTALVSNDIISSDLSLIPMLLFSLYSVFSLLGCATIPLVLVGEIFPLAHKSTGLALSNFWLTLCISIEVSYLSYIFDNFHWFFAISGVILGMSLVVLYFVMPETKDKTLQEIENYFKYGKYDAPCDKDDEENVEMISERDCNIEAIDISA